MQGQHINTTFYKEDIPLTELYKALFKLFWQQKALVALITLVCVGVSGIYLAITPPVYEANAHIIAPSVGDIASLNVGRMNQKNAPLKAFTVKDIYKMFTDTLLSESIKRAFFKQVYLPLLTDEQTKSTDTSKLFDEFSKKILIKEDSSKKPIKYTVIARANTPETSRDWAIQYIALAEKKALSELVFMCNNQIDTLSEDIQEQIYSVKKEAQKNRIDRLAQLNEALTIAKEAGIKNSMLNGAPNGLDTQSIMYLQGSKILESQIKVLNARKIDDSFTPALRDLERQYDLYSKIRISTDKIKIYRLDGAINLPGAPIAPKTLVILFLGLLLGGLIGTVTAMLRGLLLQKNELMS